MTSLKDKIVFITGASAGFGLATAERFAREGARLILAARREEKLHQLAERLDVPCLVRQLDVRERDEVNRVVADLPDDWQEVEILVNNAGLARGLEKIQDGDYVAWNEMIDTNLKGLLWVTRAILPGMIKRGRGHIINIGSIAGHELYPMGNVYCASKFAVNALNRGMLMDLVDTPIRVTSIDPGLAETEFSMVRFRGDKEKASKVYQGLTALSGDDVADAIFWAASRPEHVQIAQMTIMCTNQGGAMVVHRKA